MQELIKALGAINATLRKIAYKLEAIEENTRQLREAE